MSTISLPDVDTYAEARTRILTLVAGLDAEAAATPVPACPGWSVHDVVAHLTGIADDVLAGRMAGLGSPEWTAAQVDARKNRPLEQVCQEWRSLTEAFDRLLADQPALGLAASADAVIHEYDLRQALGQPGDHASPSIRATARRYADIFAQRVHDAGLGPLAVRTTEGDTLVDAENPVISVEGPAFELLQAMTGRRTLREVLALNWSGNPDEILVHLTPYGPLPAEPTC